VEQQQQQRGNSSSMADKFPPPPMKATKVQGGAGKRGWPDQRSPVAARASCRPLRATPDPLQPNLQEEMDAARVPYAWRDYCAHLLIPLNECRCGASRAATRGVFRWMSGAAGLSMAGCPAAARWLRRRARTRASPTAPVVPRQGDALLHALDVRARAACV
jgi:hypothetical protein